VAVSITIKLFAHYREGRFAVHEQTLPEGAVIGDVIRSLEIDEESLPLGVILLNGRHRKLDFALGDGDVLALFPKVGGG
jgi:molybdopterin synthase sulfur carrier subunit